jgi:glycosyltransferase involved in cell wall biosynthesis
MKLSIITVNKDDATGLEKTIKSVAEQTFDDFEYIVIDGASGDGSVDIIRKYADKIRYWVSEPDAGIYNAMNKGIRKAAGEYCLFLNSGDWLTGNETLKKVFAEIGHAGKADVYYSDLITDTNECCNYTPSVNINHLISGTVSHQNSIISRDLFIRHGYYNESLDISSDWEYFLKEYWFHKIKFVHIKTTIAVFCMNGISSINYKKRATEDIQVLQNVFGELSESVIELRKYRESIYGNIIENWGNSPVLEYLLKAYRFFARRIVEKKQQPAYKIVLQWRQF